MSYALVGHLNKELEILTFKEGAACAVFFCSHSISARRGWETTYKRARGPARGGGAPRRGGRSGPCGRRAEAPGPGERGWERSHVCRRQRGRFSSVPSTWGFRLNRSGRRHGVRGGPDRGLRKARSDPSAPQRPPLLPSCPPPRPPVPGPLTAGSSALTPARGVPAHAETTR